jgi:hypothetical protein
MIQGFEIFLKIVNCLAVLYSTNLFCEQKPFLMCVAGLAGWLVSKSEEVLRFDRQMTSK